jgi:PPOX class probable F420-dependent enzyme
MWLTDNLDDRRRGHVEQRLQKDLMAWLTTVGATGKPDSVPVWFLVQDDDTILVYSQRDKMKLRNIAANSNVALALDGTDTGRDVIRVAGTAQHVPAHPAADKVPAYVAKYQERIDAVFGSPKRFAQLYSEPIVITPTKLHA